MRIYLEEDVLTKAKERVAFVFDHFDNVAIGVSGGKDSQAVFELAHREALERDQTIYPIWVDQEMEYQATVDMNKEWFSRENVEPFWCQFEIHITNGAGHQVNQVKCWDPELDEDEYMRPKEGNITENTYGTVDLKEVWAHVLRDELDGSIVQLGGLRAEESPNRYLGLTNSNTFKGITYGTGTPAKDVRSIYPIYDWSYSDVWKFIYDNDLEYNKVYDWQYRNGVSIHDMRVSHLHHQQAVNNLWNLQEFEPETFNSLVRRVPGIHSTKQLGEEGILPSRPFMFEDWREYRNYLTEHLIEDERDRIRLKRHFFRQDLMTEHQSNYESSVVAGHVMAILMNDVEDFDWLNSLRSQKSTPETQAIRDKKMSWLQEERPEIWKQLEEEHIVGHFRDEYLEEDDEKETTTDSDTETEVEA